MALTIPGSELFANRPTPPEVILQKMSKEVRLHTVAQNVVDSIDPLTYEVIRHRIWATTDEMGEALKRMSGSIVVTDANDFDFAIMDELGDEVQVGLYNTEMCASMDMAVKWTLENRSENPGIEEGDMFLCNDPWVGGGIHQNDVSVFGPFFWEGKLFAWTSATCHQVDLGGVAPGSWTPRARNVFWESLPTPPVKILRKYEIQRDVEDVYLRRSRIPKLVALDLRAKVGANSFAHERLKALIGKYGPDVVKAVMKRMMDDAERRVRAKLISLPDGSWQAVSYQEEAHEGDRGIYKIVLKMTKQRDHLTFDFRGTDPQVDGMINCTYIGMRAGIITPLLPMLCGDIPWAGGGIMRCFDIISDEETLNNASFPAGVCKASVASCWATSNVVTECLSKMLDTHMELRKSALSVCCGTWSLGVLAGVDQRKNPFVSMLMDPMAGGLGARTDQDGVDTGGQLTIPMGRVPDVEMNEFMMPLLYLWRREEIDSGGPGKYRGGMAGSLCVVPYDTDHPMSLVISGSGKAVSMNGGLSGGYPGNTQQDITIRDCDVRQLFKQGIIPASLGQIMGTVEVQPGEKESYLNVNDAHYMFWQGGGGYGDPLLRDPQRVLRDVVEMRVSLEAARAIYGAAIEEKALQVDEAETERLRQRIRDKRRRDSHPVGLQADSASLDKGVKQRWDDNLAEIVHNGLRVLQCQHCGWSICRKNENYLRYLVCLEGLPADAGPQIFSDSKQFIDKAVVFRQYCCPGCYTAFLSQVVPEDHAAGSDREVV